VSADRLVWLLKRLKVVRRIPKARRGATKQIYLKGALGSRGHLELSVIEPSDSGEVGYPAKKWREEGGELKRGDKTGGRLEIGC